MILIRNAAALFVKQFKDTLKNMPVLVLFIVYPCIALIMGQALQKQVGETTLFLSIFATMHCVFTPIEATASIIAEEKESNTLRMLIMSNVTLLEYFLSIGGFVLITALFTGSAFLFMADYSFTQALSFLLIMCIGCVISIGAGICIGLYAKNTAAANGLAVPIGMVFAFLPMLSNFNSNVKAVAKFTYGQQIGSLIAGKPISSFGIAIMIINTVIILVTALLLFRKSVTEE